MEGTIRQRGRHSWQIIYYEGKDSNGKWIQCRETVKGFKKDAQNVLRQRIQAIEGGAYVKPTKKTFGDWLTEWCDSYVTMHTRPRTAESYRTEITNHIKPALGQTILTQLQPQQLQDYYAKSLISGRYDGQGGLSARTVLYHHRIINEALDSALKMGLVARNIAQAAEPPKPRHVQMKTLENIPAFLEAAKQTDYFELFFTALTTGMRQGELLGLRWKDVVFPEYEDTEDIKAYIIVNQSLYKRRGVCEMVEPKSKLSRRRINLTPACAAVLNQYKSNLTAYRIILGKPLSGDDLVFSNYNGKPLDPGTVYHTFVKTLDAAGLPRIRFHDLRHTHATLMLKQGVHPKIVSERLGHASVSFTLDIYSQVMPGLQEAAAESFDKMLGPHVANMLPKTEDFTSEPPANRTPNLLIKSQLLCQLS